jgi:hypothetical protein
MPRSGNFERTHPYRCHLNGLDLQHRHVLAKSSPDEKWKADAEDSKGAASH